VNTARLVFLFAISALTFGCWSDPSSQNGAAEQFRVRYPDPTNPKNTLTAQFVEGTLPGYPSGTAPGDHEDAGPSPLPTITTRAITATLFRAGQAGTKGTALTGEATPNAVSVAVALDDDNTGYWVVGVEAINPTTGDRSWSAQLDFGNELSDGKHSVLVVALDAKGVAGEQTSVPVCILNHVPDNLQECSPTRSPPAAIISLSWDTNVDLDLQVQTPSGLLVDAKHPFTADLTDAGAVPTAAGKMDRDSNAGCVIDGVRTENLVWNSEKPHGVYNIYANLFSACGQSAVRFVASVYTAVPNPDGGAPHLRKWVEKSGELLGFQANGGTARGLFVTSFDF
jgi:hypothetical protein